MKFSKMPVALCNIEKHAKFKTKSKTFWKHYRIWKNVPFIQSKMCVLYRTKCAFYTEQLPKSSEKWLVWGGLSLAGKSLVFGYGRRQQISAHQWLMNSCAKNHPHTQNVTLLLWRWKMAVLWFSVWFSRKCVRLLPLFISWFFCDMQT